MVALKQIEQGAGHLMLDQHNRVKANTLTVNMGNKVDGASLEILQGLTPSSPTTGEDAW